jgi:hypothetical protein
MRRMGRPGLLGTMARTAVIAGTATEVAGAVSNHNEQRSMQQQSAQQYAPAPPVAAAPAAASEGDVISQLKDLADLKTQGILTEDEFEAQKAKILAGA